MKIALISPYPPSKGTLNEYAYHLVSQFKNKDEITELTIITDKLPAGESYMEEIGKCKITFKDVWSFNSLLSPLKILKAIKQSNADVAFFNIQFLSFGDKKIPATLGLLTPFLSKINGIPSVTLLHNIIETVDYESAGITKNPILKWIYNTVGTVLTKLILASNTLAVTMPKYVRILNKKYKVNNVRHVPHGTFEVAETPDFNKGADKLQVMTFGKFGTYKKIEKMIDAVQIVRETTGKDIEIVIAGTDNPNVKGYLADVKKKYENVKDIRFTGYVEEEDVPKIFTESTVVVFPYTSTTGSSGVLHQAGSYGKAVVMPNIGDLKELIEDEGYRGEFFEPEDTIGLANAIEKLIVNKEHRIEIAKTNYKAAASLPMSEIADLYISLFRKLKESKFTSLDQKKLLVKKLPLTRQA